MKPITINHERYGVETHFSSLREATETLRECGPEFAKTELTANRDGIICDERGEAIGYYISTSPSPRA